MLEMLDMGKNSAYIWSAYGIGLVVFIVVLMQTRARRARTVRALTALRNTVRKETS